MPTMRMMRMPAASSHSAMAAMHEKEEEGENDYIDKGFRHNLRLLVIRNIL